MFNAVKYSRLGPEVPTGDATLDVQANKSAAFSFDSAFKYDQGPASGKFKSQSNYNSAFKYNNHDHVSVRMEDNDVFDRTVSQPGWGFYVTNFAFTFFSYLLFVLTLPITYWIFVKKLGEFDRLVVFRLGKMQGVKGPGRVIIFPWMDRTKRIDVRASAFNVSPQQFITCDGGIVELGAEIQYGIVDVVTMVSEVADHQDILRSLGKTLVVKVCVKKTVSQLEKDKRTPAQAIQDDLNDQVRKWGIDVHKVELSNPKILKQPESSSNTAVGSILKGLGMKGEQEYPSPEEFVRASHGLETEGTGAGGSSSKSVGPASSGGAPASVDLSNHVSAFSCLPPPEIPQGVDMNMSLLQMMASGTQLPGGGTALAPGVVCGSNVELPGGSVDKSKTASATVCNWGKCLEVILASEFTGPLEQDACGLYKIEIDVDGVKETYFIEMTQTVKKVHVEVHHGKPDVSVSVTSSDLSSILEGSLAPLQAYLTGRISAHGDVRKLMFFDKLSRRGHKPGTMFSV